MTKSRRKVEIIWIVSREESEVPSRGSRTPSRGMTGVISRAGSLRSNPHHSPITYDPTVAAWLLLCCALVLAVVVVGGVTRLTHSGLSIVEWDPVIGAWRSAAPHGPRPSRATAHAGIPEGQPRHVARFLRGNLLGRVGGWLPEGHLIGVVFFLPFVSWLARGRLPVALVPRLLGLLVLGGLQGALGWYMVASGLVDVPRVSTYRLAAHLALAAIIFGGLFWTALDLLRPQPSSAFIPPRLRRLDAGSRARFFSR